MAQAKLSTELAKEALDTWEACGHSKQLAAARLNIPWSTFKARLRAAERYGLVNSIQAAPQSISAYVNRLNIDVKDGVVIVGSDAHYWPNATSPAHKAFIKIIKELKPKVVIQNGDVLDGAGISRHASIGWEKKPTLIEEVEECFARLEDAELAAGKGCKLIWTLGNHDMRFESRLAHVAPEYAKVHGVRLKDHFPKWQFCWSTWINNNVVVKHRWKGGIHATHNNTMGAGKTFVTGHLHSLKVTPWTDYNGTRWGVDCGTLAPIEPMGGQFSSYLEDNPMNWRSGFVVLTFKNGVLADPETVRIINAKTYCFRGEFHKI